MGRGDLKHEGRRPLLPDLPAVDDFLIEDAEFVADAIAVRSQAQGSHGVQEAGWKKDSQMEKNEVVSSSHVETMHLLQHAVK